MAPRTTATRIAAIAAMGALAVAGVGGTTAAAAVPSQPVVVPALGYDPADTGSMSSITQIIGAQSAWAAGWTGAGVDVAVIDTGVSPVPGLDAPGKVVTGPDLSFDAPGATRPGLDAYGHGTFMAGLIAGRDAGVTASATGCTTCVNGSGYSDRTKFVGVAPEARIVNLKVGASDGATDVTQVIAALDWVTQHAHDPGRNIRVVSLSYGTVSNQSYLLDPLAHAAEQAWKHGVVVVVAAGNDGKALTSLAAPAYDPYVLAVGADDPNGTLDTTDDRVPLFAQHGNPDRPVDVIAPGVHVLGLRVPGSFVDTLSTNTGLVGTRFQRGSGTSEATAIVSGAVALLAQRYPAASPDQLKALLRATATPKGAGITDTRSILAFGKGIAHVGRAVTTALPVAAQSAAASSGLGTLDATRGGVTVVTGGVALTGQRDIFGHAYSSSTAAAARSQSRAWTGGTWSAGRWTGDGWVSGAWATAAWTSASWAGTSWATLASTGMAWDGSRWSGSRWSSSRWSGSTWDSSRWSSSTWA